jgi:hypothetical protein
MEEEKNKENEEIIEDVNIQELRHYEEEEEEG